MDAEQARALIAQARKLGATEEDVKTLIAAYTANRDISESDFKQKHIKPILIRLKAEGEKAKSQPVQQEKVAEATALLQETQLARKIMDRKLQRRGARIWKEGVYEDKDERSGSSVDTDLPKPADTGTEGKAGSKKQTVTREQLNTALAKDKGTLDAANEVLKQPNPGPSVQAASKAYTSARAAFMQSMKTEAFDDAMDQLKEVVRGGLKLVEEQKKDVDAGGPKQRLEAFKAAYGKASPLLKSAQAAAVRCQDGSNVAQLKEKYLAVSAATVKAVQAKNFDEALKLLPGAEKLAQQVMAARQADDKAFKGVVDATLKDTQKRVAQILEKTRPLYSKKAIEGMRAHEKDDKQNDFVDALAKLAALRKADFDQAVLIYQDARNLAQKYKDDHPEPKIGKLKKSVAARVADCEKLISDINKQLQAMDAQDKVAAEMCKSYRRLFKDQRLPHEVIPELQKLAGNFYISGATKKLIKATIDEIRDGNRKMADEALKSANSDADKASVLLEYGCHKDTGGGTSDVKLLTNNDGSVAYAYKSLEGESQQAIDFLKLKAGAGTIREAVSSQIHQNILDMCGLDLGFPKAEVMDFDGKSGALIEGIKGKMADPEERMGAMDKVRLATPGEEQDRAQAKLDQIEKDLKDLPDKITPDSMQDVVLSQMLTCQWDCKWGNMIVDGNRARPIDAGTAIPTAAVIKDFLTDFRGAKPPALGSLTEYPLGHPKAFQKMPLADLPMGKAKVEAILKIDEKKLVAEAKAKRDQLVAEVPEFDASLMDDTCFDIVAASITAVKDIVAKKQDITLAEFVDEYGKWFLEWGKKYAT